MPVLRWKGYCVRSLPDDEFFIARHLLVALSSAVIIGSAIGRGRNLDLM
jgi:hypothetical protein